MQIPTIPYRGYKELRPVANAFLEQFNPAGTIPVPIEHIVEFEFGIDIVPIPTLKKVVACEAFITSDFKTIYIDEDAYGVSNRYRFGLAHELAHVLVHQDVYKAMKFRSSEEWKKAMEDFPFDQRDYLEIQANKLAGLILVPENQLKTRFEQKKEMISERVKREFSDFNPVSMTAAILDLSVSQLATDFEVAQQTMEIRFRTDGLLTNSK